MIFSKKILLTVLSLSATMSLFAANDKTVRHVNTEFDTKNLIVPESFEADTHKLMEEWYLKRYAVMDKDADSRKSVTLSDDEYISRLQRMPTSIEMPFNDLVKSFIKMYVERRKGLVEAMLGLSMYYMPIFEDALERHGLPMELKNLAIIESALNPNAVSKAGATGLWQFMSSTAKGEGLEVNTLVDERRDPYKSSDAAARFLKKLYNMYGDWSLAIAAYNCGPGNVNKALRRAGGGKKDFWEIYNFLPAETRNYIPAFIAANYAMTYYKEHNISPVLASRPVIVDSVLVNQRVHFQQISDVLGIPMDEIRALNPQYRTDVIPGDIKPYALILPHIQTLCFIEYQDSIINHDYNLYARRDVAEPGGKRKEVKTTEQETPEENLVAYHKIKNDDTVESIAERYGVPQSEVIRANGGSNTLRRGQTLALNTTDRKWVASNKTDSVAEQKPEVAKDLAVVPPPPAKPKTTPVQVPPPPKKEQAKDNSPAKRVSNALNNSDKKNAAKKEDNKSKAKSSTYTIRQGDNLTKIASQNGISIEQLKKANNLKGDQIKAGDKLTIPGKNTGKGGGGKNNTAKNKKRK